jgi:hypothetical protein
MNDKPEPGSRVVFVFIMAMAIIGAFVLAFTNP